MFIKVNVQCTSGGGFYAKKFYEERIINADYIISISPAATSMETEGAAISLSLNNASVNLTVKETVDELWKMVTGRYENR